MQNEHPPAPRKSQAEIHYLLRCHGVTPTSQRVRIATTIFAEPQHFSADQLLARTNSDGRHVSKATVYNTLELFARKGLIRQLIIDPQRVFYDSSTHPHHHFYDPETRELTDFDCDQIDIRLPANLPPGSEIANVDVIIHLRRPAAAEAVR